MTGLLLWLVSPFVAFALLALLVYLVPPVGSAILWASDRLMGAWLWPLALLLALPLLLLAVMGEGPW